MRKLFAVLFLAILISGCSESSPPTGAQTMPATQGFSELPPPLPKLAQNQGTVEIVEFFSYGCDHCARFNPMLEQWLQSHPQVHLVKVPVSFSRAQFQTLAKLYFAIHDLGHGQLDDAVFEAIHTHRQDLTLPAVRRQWAMENRIPPDLLENRMASPEVDQKLGQADQLSAQAMIEGVPTLVVNGRYSISLDQAGTFDNLLSGAESLLGK